jgi:hypothetical protein
VSYDDHSIHYCLTENGWVSTDDESSSEACIEKWVKRVTQASGYSREHVQWSKLWTNPLFTEAQIEELRKRFPQPKHGEWTQEQIEALRISN